MWRRYLVRRSEHGRETAHRRLARRLLRSNIRAVGSPYNFLTDYLTKKKLTKNGIRPNGSKLVDDEKIISRNENHCWSGARSLMARDVSQQHKITAAKLLALRLLPVRSMGVTMKIEKNRSANDRRHGCCKGLSFSIPHSPTQLKPLIWILPKQMAVFNGSRLPIVIFLHCRDGNNAGGAWYLCYNQNDLPGYERH